MLFIAVSIPRKGSIARVCRVCEKRSVAVVVFCKFYLLDDEGVNHK
jgi:hypothetical protein